MQLFVTHHQKKKSDAKLMKSSDHLVWMFECLVEHYAEILAGIEERHKQTRINYLQLITKFSVQTNDLS